MLRTIANSNAWRLLVALAIPAVFMLGGCVGTPGRAKVGEHEISVKPMVDHEGHARSLAMSSPTVRRQRAYYARHGYNPAYYDRLDRHPAVTIGVQSPTLRRSVTTTYDSLHTTPSGDVHDHYHRTTHRYRATQTVN